MAIWLTVLRNYGFMIPPGFGSRSTDGYLDLWKQCQCCERVSAELISPSHPSVAPQPWDVPL